VREIKKEGGSEEKGGREGGVRVGEKEA